MDPDTKEALADIKTDVRQGFSDMKAEIKELVTRGEFAATVQRLDSQHDNLRRDLTSHVEEAPGHRRAAREHADAVRRDVNGTIWKAVTLAVSIATLAMAGISLLANYLTA